MGKSYSKTIYELSKNKNAGKLQSPDKISQSFFNKTPIKIYNIIVDLHSNPYFIFVMNNEEFKHFVKDSFEIDDQSVSDAVGKHLSFEYIHTFNNLRS